MAGRIVRTTFGKNSEVAAVLLPHLGRFEIPYTRATPGTAPTYNRECCIPFELAVGVQQEYSYSMNPSFRNPTEATNLHRMSQ